MPFNWYIEVLKWKISLKSITNISTQQAIAGILSGVSLGFITPHAVGDYFARIWSIKHSERQKAIVPILITRSAQFIPTLSIGLLALVHSKITLSKWFKIAYFDSTFYIVISLFISIVLTVYFIVKHKSLGSIVAYYLHIFSEVRMSTYWQIIALSFLRYFIFSIQFLCLLSIFEIQMSLLDQLYGVAFMFLLKSILPTFNFLSDLGVREFSAIIYFEAYNINTAPVILASLFLWCVNIMLPAIAGLFFVKDFKIDLKK